MKTTCLRGSAAALFVGLTFSAANAATVTDTFSFTSLNHGGYTSSIAMTAASGLGLTITAETYNDTTKQIYDTNSWVGQWNGAGLGACSTITASKKCSDENHQVDSTGKNDILLFAFTKEVKIEKISFNYVDSGDTFDLLYKDGAWSFGEQGYASSSYDVVADLISDTFGIGAVSYEYTTGTGKKKKTKTFESAFKIKSMTVSWEDTPPPAPVPVPAAGMLLVAGLGALGMVKRRKRA